MRHFVNVNCGAALLLCVVALPASVYPGGLQDLFMPLLVLFCVVFVVGPVWLIWLLALLVLELRQKRKPLTQVPWRRVVGTFAILLLVYATLKFYIPRRVVFPFHKDSFATHVAGAPESEFMGEPFERRLGIYHVDEYAKDPRGGVYFRVNSTADMINIVSWGFAYQPNDEGSPFGNAHYSVHPLGGGWYWFTANDDW